MKVVHPFALMVLATFASAFVSALASSAANDASTPLRRLETTGFDPVGSPLVGHPSFNETGRGKVQFGATVALASATGTRLVVGAPLHDFKDDEAANVDGGGIFLYELNSDGDWNAESPLWSLFGQLGEQLGEHLSLSGDGTRVAVRRKNPSSVEVYDIPSGTKVGASDVLCADGAIGDAVSLSPSGTRVATSCRSTTGSVEIFEFDDADDEWTPIGQLQGLANNDLFGFTTAFSTNGDRLAVSSPNHDANGSNSGLVQVFQYDAPERAWVQVGDDILGQTALDQFGFAMDLSGDGSTLVASAPNAAGNDGTARAGQVSVWAHDVPSDSWIQVGSTVSGSELNDRLGRSLSISQDFRFAVGSWAHSTSRGLVLLFEFDSAAFDWVQIASATGENAGDRLAFGRFSVSLATGGQRMAAGEAFARNADNEDTGRVVVFDMSIDVEPLPLPMSAAPSATPSTSPTVAVTTAPSAASATNTPTVTSAEPTAAPTTQGTPSPTAAPTTRATSTPTLQDGDVSLSKLDWDLEPIHTEVRFSEETDGDEIVMTYNINRRDVSVQVFQDDCSTMVNETVIGVSHTTIPASPTHSTLEISLDVHQDSLVGNPIYSATDTENGLLELCTRVDLLAADGTPVVFHELKHVIRVQLTSSFTVTAIELERTGAAEDEISVDLEYGVTACHCNDDFDCQTEGAVSQNQIVNICVQTSVNTILISEIRTLELSQAGLSHVTIANGEAGDFTDVILNPNGDGQKAVIQTILLSSFFASDEPEDVLASGSVALTFVDESGTARNLRAEMSFDSRDLQDEEVQETGYVVTLAIASESEEDSSASSAGLSVAIVALVAATFTLI